MEIPEPRYQLSAHLLNSINNIWSPLLLEIDIHVFALHQLHDDMVLPGLIGPIVLSHEILVLNYLRVDEVLSDTEFAVHFLESSLSQFRVVVDFPELVNKLTPELLYFDLEYLSLGSGPDLFLHDYV